MTSILRALRGPPRNRTETSVVFLDRLNGHIKIKGVPKRFTTPDSIKLMGSWIKASNFTLDIAIFFVLHKRLVDLIIKRQKRGVCCRIIIQRYLMDGPKKDKYVEYIDKLKTNGVQIKYISEAPIFPVYRMVLMDCGESDGFFFMCYNEPCIILGNNRNVISYDNHLVLQMRHIKMSNGEPCLVHGWRKRFNEMWNNEECLSTYQYKQLI